MLGRTKPASELGCVCGDPVERVAERETAGRGQLMDHTAEKQLGCADPALCQRTAYEEHRRLARYSQDCVADAKFRRLATQVL